VNLISVHSDGDDPAREILHLPLSKARCRNRHDCGNARKQQRLAPHPGIYSHAHRYSDPRRLMFSPIPPRVNVVIDLEKARLLIAAVLRKSIPVCALHSHG
jgi:hypothetical protein